MLLPYVTQPAPDTPIHDTETWYVLTESAAGETVYQQQVQRTGLSYRSTTANETEVSRYRHEPVRR